MSARALLIFTGPSHAGKSTAARATMRSLTTPSAHVAIDDIMDTLDLASEDPWEQGLPAAYDVAAAAADALLQRDFVVLLESTFTYIPEDDRPGQFHHDQLARFVGLAQARDAPVAIVRLHADLEELLRRQGESGRMHRGVIEGTWAEHRADVALDVPTIDVATPGLSPEDMAERVTAALRRP